MNLAELRAAFEAARNLNNLRALRDGLEAELRSLNEEAGSAEFSEEQETRWAELEAEHTGLKAEEEKLLRSTRLAESRKKFGANVAPAKPDTDVDVRSQSGPALRSRAMGILDNKDLTQHLGDIALPGDTGFLDEARAKTHIEKLLRTNNRNFNGQAFARWMVATEAPAYRSAFPKLVGQAHPILTEEEGRAVQLVNELRATMNITTDAQGGYGIPVLIDPTIILTGQGTPNDFFQIARVENITNDEWRGLTSAGATSYWTTEGVTFTDGSPTLAQPSVPTKKLTTLVKYTFEFQGDYPNWASEMATIMGESHSEKLVEAFTQGLGTTAQPQGIVTGLEANAATSKVMVTTDGSLGAVDYYNLWAALPVRYKNNARWMQDTTVSNAVRQFAAGTGMEGDLPRLFGKPVHYNDYMDDAVGSGGTTSASDYTPAIVGDWRGFLIANRIGATIETVQHMIDTTSGNPNGTRGTFMWARVGSGVVNPNAFRYLHQSA
jgi:HK97 family phage major capsid protein